MENIFKLLSIKNNNGIVKNLSGKFFLDPDKIAKFGFLSNSKMKKRKLNM